MSTSRFRRGSTPTLHRTWSGTVLKFVGIIVALGVMTFGIAQYQRSAFDRTVSDLEHSLGALTDLNLAFMDSAEPTATLLYSVPGPDAAKHVAAYEVARDGIEARFDKAAVAMPSPALRGLLRETRQRWQALDATISAAPELIATGAVAAALAQRIDPFKDSVWAVHTGISRNFAELERGSVTALHRETARVQRVQQWIPALVFLFLVFALTLAWMAARKMSRQILAPLTELNRAARAMRDTDLDGAIELDGASRELQDLAATINETALSLRSSHGLLRVQASTDPLTGLPNRSAFNERLRGMLGEPDGGRVAVLFVDLDDFKVVNDSLGHAAGDELLCIVAQRLRSSVRADELVARLGGDEFAIAIDCGDGPAAATTVAQRVLASLEERITIGDTAVSVGCSVGIATSTTGAGPAAADELMRNADFAMYMAKSQGKNRFEVFAASMHTEMLARTELQRDLAQACRLDQFTLHYQPIVELATGGLLGFEALIRWQHPTRGLLAPGAFIELAEDTGAIVEIGAWVLDRACADLAIHHRDSGAGSALWMSVNVSAHQLASSTFPATVIETLQRHGIPAECLILEITERVALANLDTAGTTLGELRRHGIHIALDDFGTGFSSLRSLNELPVDVIKIDRSFVMSENRSAESMLEAMVALGQRLGLGIIAEGIEQPAELERLRRLGPLAGQGYHLARPMPAADATTYRRHNATNHPGNESPTLRAVG